MHTFKMQVFEAQLNDLGYSGEWRGRTGVGFFTLEEDALAAATEFAGDPAKTGKEPAVESKELDIKVFENLEEFHTAEEERLADEAMMAMTPEQLNAFKKRLFRRGK